MRPQIHLIPRTVRLVEGISRCLSSSISSESNRITSKFFPLYTHFLSQGILEYLQNEKSEWVRSHGLENALDLNSNGTFVLRFPPSNGKAGSGHIW
mmetsp:Transcript_19596/g.29074  ORF Transcript_19596/g.29074 Transcript_19596/m.29074 type:complete len:96 (-) Transcript_19596:92-379(-)